MACETFIAKRFNAEHETIIERAVEMLEELHRDGYEVTLRSLYYYFIAEERWFPNTIQSYKRFGDIIGCARLAGRIDWDLINDNVRKVEELARWSSPEHIMESVVSAYREDLWDGQEVRVHVRIEKDAQIGVVRPVCERWRVPFLACRGNSSLSEMYRAGKKLEEESWAGLRSVILYLGDHDPSGIDMTRDNNVRLSLFSGSEVEVRRIALNRDQIDELHLPGNPAKLTDSRAGLRKDGSIIPGSYIDLHGYESWEMDALRPRYIDDLIEREIGQFIDMDRWNERKAQEDHNHGILASIKDQWPKVEELFGGDEEEI
jgi:hypothetical protein